MTRMRLSVRRGSPPAPRPVDTHRDAARGVVEDAKVARLQALVEEGRADPVVFIEDVQAA
jgi:hypothetical protein